MSELNSNTFSIKNLQFGRFAQVEIKDFHNKTKTIFGNDFEIEFDYFKTLDQTEEDDTGVIKIYGLKPSTVKSLQSEGGEVALKCGYLGTGSIYTLFVASIARLYYDIENNTTVTTIECSANLMSHYITGTISPDNGEMSFYMMFAQMAAEMGAGFNILLPSVPDVDEIAEYLQTGVINYSSVGSQNDNLTKVAETNSFEISTDTSSDGGEKIVVMSIKEKGIELIRKKIKQGYSKVKSLTPPEVSDERKNRIKILESSYEANGTDGYGIVLSPKTGLISSKTEYKIANAYADQILNANEEETDKSIANRQKREAKEREKAQKEEQKKADALAKGKKYTPPKSSTPAQRVPIKVNRKYKKVIALLNPEALPQRLVQIAVDENDQRDIQKGGVRVDKIESFDEGFIVHRIRNARYKGNNKKGDWIMELYCEDSVYNAMNNPYTQDYLQGVNPENISEEDDLTIETDDFGE